MSDTQQPDSELQEILAEFAVRILNARAVKVRGGSDINLAQPEEEALAAIEQLLASKERQLAAKHAAIQSSLDQEILSLKAQLASKELSARLDEVQKANAVVMNHATDDNMAAIHTVLNDRIAQLKAKQAGKENENE